jgi:hypothetical protein
MLVSSVLVLHNLHAKNENNEGEARNLVEKTTVKIELKIASRKFEEEEEGEKKQPVLPFRPSHPPFQIHHIVFR